MQISDYATIEKLRLTTEELSTIEPLVSLLQTSFAHLSNVNTENTEPLVSVLDIQNVLRDDISYKMLPREELLSNAPEQYNGFFQVPKTIE